MALRFYSSVRLEVRKGQAIKSNGEMVGTKVRRREGWVAAVTADVTSWYPRSPCTRTPRHFVL